MILNSGHFPVMNVYSGPEKEPLNEILRLLLRIR